MKDNLRTVLVLGVALVCAFLPLWAFYGVWSWCIGQVPDGIELAGLFRVAVTLLLLILLGWPTVGLAWMGFGVGGKLAAGWLGVDE